MPAVPTIVAVRPKQVESGAGFASAAVGNVEEMVVSPTVHSNNVAMTTTTIPRRRTMRINDIFSFFVAYYYFFLKLHSLVAVSTLTQASKLRPLLPSCVYSTPQSICH